MRGQLAIILLPARQNGTRVTVEGRWPLEESGSTEDLCGGSTQGRVLPPGPGGETECRRSPW